MRVFNHRELLLQLVIRELASRYRNSIFGFLWFLLTPLLMLVIFTFFFSSVLNTRWPTAEGAPVVGFPFLLFSGLIIHSFFSEVMTRSPLSIVNQPNYVKKIIFPLGLIPWVIVLCALFQMIISVLVLIVMAVVSSQPLSASIVWLPLAIFPLVCFAVGMALILSSVGVYLRDLAQIMNLAVTALLFVSPVFFSVEMLPEKWIAFAYLNPLTVIIEYFRSVIFFNGYPSLDFMLYSVASVVVFTLGHLAFGRLRPGFSDVV